MAIKDKLITLEELDNATSPSNYTICPTPYNGNEQIPMMLQGNRYATTVNELLFAAGGGGGTTQGALVNYVKNCGTISSLPQTISDSNITSNMVVLEAVLGTPSAQTGDWSVSTANGSVTISGSITGSTTLMLYFGVGMTTAPSLMTNLASTSADNILKAAPRPGVMGTLGLANGGTGQNASSAADLRSKLGITPANIGAVDKAGDTMTGNLRIEHSGDTFVKVSNSNAASVYLESDGEGRHGLWSPGYYNGSDFITSNQWLIRRVGDGKVIVADHYNKDEVDSAIQQSAATVSGTFVESSNISANVTTCSKSANIGIVSINVTMAAIDTQSSWCPIGTISIHPSQYTYGVVTDDSSAKSCRILGTGEIDIWKPVAGTQYVGNISFTL